MRFLSLFFFFFFNDTATTEIYTLSLHDALPISYLAHAAEPWRLPDAAALPRFPVRFRTDPAGFHPLLRDPATLARAWAVPGTPGLEHRIGGVEEGYRSGERRVGEEGRSWGAPDH